MSPVKSKFTADPRYSSGVVDEFYHQRDEVTSQYKTFQLLNPKNTMQINRLKAKADAYSDAAKQISELRKEETKLLETMPSGEMRQRRINRIREQINDIARKAIGR